MFSLSSEVDVTSFRPMEVVGILDLVPLKFQLGAENWLGRAGIKTINCYMNFFFLLKIRTGSFTRSYVDCRH